MANTFGELVRGLRQKRDLTLEKVAKAIQSHKGYVSGIERGKVAPPSMKFIQKMAKLFQFDVKTLAWFAYLEKAPKEIKSDERFRDLERKVKMESA